VARYSRLVVVGLLVVLCVACGEGSHAQLSADDAERVARDHLGTMGDAQAEVRLDVVNRHDCALVTFDSSVVILSASDGEWAVMDNGNPNLGSGYDPSGQNCLTEP
jgi:hypothetical protein